jgi:iron complex transport system substrate-binding protein
MSKVKVTARFGHLVWIAALVPAAVVLAGSAAAATAKPQFPLTVKAANGAIAIPRQPQRIVSLSATATENLFAVGAGKQVVAVDSYSTYPKNAPHTSLSAYKPNLEAIAEYRPDLVVISDDADRIAEDLSKLHVPVLLEPAAANLNAVYGELDQIGKATRHALGAARTVATSGARGSCSS